MKIKVAIASVAVVAIAVVSFAFAPKKAVTEFYYLSGTEYQRLEAGHTTQSDLREQTINSSFFTNLENWTEDQQNFNPTQDMSQFIGSIKFELDNATDGGSDGALTLQEALNAVFTQYQVPSPDAMQSTYTIGNCVVTITAADAKH